MKVREAGRKGYWLRAQEKSWREIAEATGVLQVYEGGNFLIESRTRTYAKRHKLPWPPTASGENA